MDKVADFSAATFAGVVGKLIDHPADTVKVRIQDRCSQYKGYWHCIRSIAHVEGVSSFYGGLFAPIASSVMEKTIVFEIFGRTIRALAGPELAAAPSHQQPLVNVAIAGGGAGFVVTAVNTPAELIKVRMQVQNTLPLAQRQYTGVLHCFKTTCRTEGLRTLYRGHSATISRDLFWTATYFVGYNVALRQCAAVKGDAPLTSRDYMLSGAVAGVCGTIWYPTDVVKTRMQLDAAACRRGLCANFADLVKEGGVRNLYRGWAITAARAIPANAAVFLTFEHCSAWLRGR